MDIAKLIDHTELRPEQPFGRYTELCREAVANKFHSVCVNSFFVPLVSNLLHSYVHTDMNVHVDVCSVIGFPHGIGNIESKVAEMKQAFNDGATEFDFVMNLSAAKTADWKRVHDEFVTLRNTIPTTEKFHPILKVILEVGILQDEEIKRACDIAVASKIDFVKTSTGVNIKLPFEETLKYSKLLMDLTKNTPTLVKASGGIKTLEQCKQLIDCGVQRIGSSNGVSIMAELNGR